MLPCRLADEFFLGGAVGAMTQREAVECHPKTKLFYLNTFTLHSTTRAARPLPHQRGQPSMYASQTEASWARSAKLTEFQRVKEAVRRLEHTSREQLVREATDEHSWGRRPCPIASSSSQRHAGLISLATYQPGCPQRATTACVQYSSMGARRRPTALHTTPSSCPSCGHCSLCRRSSARARTYLTI